jgi:hypothetical protein
MVDAVLLVGEAAEVDASSVDPEPCEEPARRP